MRIFVDADGCPVVDITIKLAKEYKLECTLLCDTSHIINKEGAKTITVSKGADSVDFALVNMLYDGDIVITQDYGLAAMCLAKKAVPMNQNGLVFDNFNIDSLLLQRHSARKMRMNRIKLKGNSKRTPQQNIDFENTLIKVIEKQL